MKATVEIEGRVRDLLEEELRRRLARPVVPSACSHNYRHALDHRKTLYGEPNGSYNRISGESEEVEGRRVSLPVVQTIGLCMLGADSVADWPGTLCEEPIDAQRCPQFVYKLSRKAVYDTFVGEVSSPAWVETSLPAVHALLWVLGGTMQVGQKSFLRGLWDRLWRWGTRGRRQRSADVLVYLPPLDACPDEDRTRAPTAN